MPWAAAAAAAAAIGGAVISSSGAKSAAKTEAAAANQADQTQLAMFNQTQANEQPFLTSGVNALNVLNAGLAPGGQFTTPFSAAQYQQSPGYQFQLGQGLSAVTNNASVRQGLDSGNTLRALTQFGQGLANSDYQQAYNNYVNWLGQQFGQFQTIAGSGQNAAANLGSLGTQTANAIGNNITSAGSASAAAQVAGANAASGALNNGVSNYLLFNALNSGGGVGAATNWNNYGGNFSEFPMG